MGKILHDYNSIFKQVDGITDVLQKAASALQEEQIQKCKRHRVLPGEFFRRINVMGDRSYDDYSVKIINVYDTYVEAEAVDSQHVVNFSLIDFSDKLEPVSKSFESVQCLIDELLCYYLDEDVIQAALGWHSGKSIKQRFCGASGQLSMDKSFSIQNDTCKIDVVDCLLGRTVDVTYRTDDKTKFKVFGTDLDIPYVLAVAKEKSLEREQIETLVNKIVVGRELCFQILNKAKEKHMISEDYVSSRKDVIDKHALELMMGKNQLVKYLARD